MVPARWSSEIETPGDRLRIMSAIAASYERDSIQRAHSDANVPRAMSKPHV